MALFEVEGWGLENKEIKLGGASGKKKDKKPKQPKKEKKAEVDESEPFHHDKAGKKRKHEQREKQSAEKRVKKERAPVPEAAQAAPAEPAAELTTAPAKLTPLQQKMLAKLSGSRFRYINEKLYTITSDEALKLIEEQPALFDVYHEGFKSQVQSWPENPVDVFVDQIKARSLKQVNAPGGLPGLRKTREIVIADMGCGEAQLSADVSAYVKKMPKKQKKEIVVHSFDLKKANDRITVADIRNVPLPAESCSVVIFCLALMGTNFLDFIKEAHRLLVPRGELWVSEIKSRFTDKQGEEFVKTLKLLGFFHKTTDDSNKMFTRFEFFKPSQDVLEEKSAKLQRHNKLAELESSQREEFDKKRRKANESQWLLKPCIYKRR